MIDVQSPLGGKKTLPLALRLACLILAVFGLLGLIGSLLPPRDAKSLFGASESLIVVTAAILVFLGHKWASEFVLFSAIMATIDLPAYLLLHRLQMPPGGVEDMIVFFVRPLLYWGAYFWFRKWQTGSPR